MRALVAFVTFSTTALLSSYAAGQTKSPEVPALQADIETVYTLPDGQVVHRTGHLYRSRTGQMREDSQLGAVITDLSAGTVTILVDETKEAHILRIPAEQRTMPAASKRPAPEVFEEATLAGHRVAKSRTKGPQGEQVEFWTAKDLGVVTWTRMESAGFVKTKELTNLSTEDPDPAVFAIPADYAVIEQDATPPDGQQKIFERPQAIEQP